MIVKSCFVFFEISYLLCIPPMSSYRHSLAHAVSSWKFNGEQLVGTDAVDGPDEEDTFCVPKLWLENQR